MSTPSISASESVKAPVGIRERIEAWKEHIAKAGPQGWHSSARSRAQLPLADHMTDGNRHRFLCRMVKEGHLRRTGRGRYTVFHREWQQNNL